MTCRRNPTAQCKEWIGSFPAHFRPHFPPAPTRAAGPARRPAPAVALRGSRRAARQPRYAAARAGGWVARDVTGWSSHRAVALCFSPLRLGPAARATALPVQPLPGAPAGERGGAFLLTHTNVEGAMRGQRTLGPGAVARAAAAGSRPLLQTPPGPGRFTRQSPLAHPLARADNNCVYYSAGRVARGRAPAPGPRGGAPARARGRRLLKESRVSARLLLLRRRVATVMCLLSRQHQRAGRLRGRGAGAWGAGAAVARAGLAQRLGPSTPPPFHRPGLGTPAAGRGRGRRRWRRGARLLCDTYTCCRSLCEGLSKFGWAARVSRLGQAARPLGRWADGLDSHRKACCRLRHSRVEKARRRKSPAGGSSERLRQRRRGAAAMSGPGAGAGLLRRALGARPGALGREAAARPRRPFLCMRLSTGARVCA